MIHTGQAGRFPFKADTSQPTPQLALSGGPWNTRDLSGPWRTPLSTGLGLCIAYECLNREPTQGVSAPACGSRLLCQRRRCSCSVLHVTLYRQVRHISLRAAAMRVPQRQPLPTCTNSVLFGMGASPRGEHAAPVLLISFI